MSTNKTTGLSLSPDARKKWKVTFKAWALIFPSLVFLCIFTMYPIVNTIYSSLFEDNLAVAVPRFVGFNNYTNLLNDRIFVKAFQNNLLVAVTTIPTSILLAVAMALFANKVRFARSFVRTSFFYPTLMPMIAVANVWLFVYTPKYGLLGYINPNWRLLGNSTTAIWALIVMLIWKQAGYVMIFYISGLQGISQEMYEAARIDGANPLTIFRSITWPLLQPTTIFVAILTLTNAYKLVDHLYIMTKGGPNNSTNMLLYYIFQMGFDFWDTGVASAITVTLVVLLLIVSCVQFFVQDRKTFYS